MTIEQPRTFRTEAGRDLYHDHRNGMVIFPDAMRSRILAIEAEAQARPEQDEAVPDAPEEHLDSNGEPYICNCPFHLATPPPATPAAPQRLLDDAYERGRAAERLAMVQNEVVPAALDALKRLVSVLDRHPEAHRLDSGELGGEYVGALIEGRAVARLTTPEASGLDIDQLQQDGGQE